MARPGRVAVVAVALAVAGIAGCLPASIRPTPVPPPTPTPGPSFTLHTVVRGDSLTSIARKYDTSGRSIAYWNRDEYPSLDPESADYQPNDLKRGWVLRVLPGQEYEPPADDGETGEQVTPSPDDSEEYETLPPDASEEPG